MHIHIFIIIIHNCKIYNQMGNSFLDKPITNKTVTTNTNHQFRYTTCEMQGWRKFMEDAYIAELTLPQYTQIALFGVFDGHGGGQVSKFVSNHFVECFIKRKSLAEGNIGQALKETFIQVQLMLKTKTGIQQCLSYKEQYMKTKVSKQQLQAGTTATVIAITSQKIICANAGDSRAALYTGGKVIPLSFDHKPQNPVQRQRIQKTGVPIIQGRVNGLNLTRSIGDFQHKQVKGLQFNKQPVICFPDIIQVDRKSQDKFIILGCDGIWQRYGDDHTQLTLHFEKQLQSKQTQDALKQYFDHNIVSNSSSPYGKDNMTAILIQFLQKEIKNQKKQKAIQEVLEQKLTIKQQGSKAQQNQQSS